MDNNKVTVRIYGQEYTIMGSQSRENIIKVAEHVDNKMKEISNALSTNNISSVAVLTAVNIADDFFSALERFDYLETANEKAERDIAKYVELWEEAKKSHIQQQEELKELQSQGEFIKNRLEGEITDLKQQLEEKKEELRMLREQTKKIEGQMLESSSDMVNELEAKYKDLESSFFDIQMENIQLKGEVDRYRKKLEL